MQLTRLLTHPPAQVSIQKKRKKNHLIKKLSKNINPRERHNNRNREKDKKYLYDTMLLLYTSLYSCLDLFLFLFVLVTIRARYRHIRTPQPTHSHHERISLEENEGNFVRQNDSPTHCTDDVKAKKNT